MNEWVLVLQGGGFLRFHALDALAVTLWWPAAACELRACMVVWLSVCLSVYRSVIAAAV